MPGKAILHREPQLLEPQQPDGIGNPPLQFAADLLIDPAVDEGQTVHQGIHGLTPIDGCIDRVTRRTGDRGEAVVAPGTPDAVRHHDPRKDRQRGPARGVYLGQGRSGFKSDAALIQAIAGSASATSTRWDGDEHRAGRPSGHDPVRGLLYRVAGVLAQAGQARGARVQGLAGHTSPGIVALLGLTLR